MLVLEKAEHPREKVCGEGLMPHGVECLRVLGVVPDLYAAGATDFVGIDYHHGDVVAHGRFPVRSSGAVGLGVRRVALDQTLYRLARDTEGVEVRTGVRVTGLRVQADGVHVRTSQGDLRADVVVGADGLHSLVRKQVGLAVKGSSEQRFGARVHYRLSEGVSAGDRVHVYMRPELEFYVTPTGVGELNVAVLCDKRVTKRFGGRLHEGLHELLMADPDLAKWLDGAVRITQSAVWGPLRQRVRAAATDRVVLVGDAAGFVDAITGEGMSIALMAAELAAEELDGALTAGDLSARRLLRYHRRKHRQSASLLWLTRVILWGMRNRALAAWVVRNLARHPATFDRLLAVQSQHRTLFQLGPGHLVRLLTGL
ncbi:MAG: flavin-dependent dehydrogenase [Kiritimatiellia bacterium]